MQMLLTEPGTPQPTAIAHREVAANERVSTSFIVALALHGALIGGAAAWALYDRSAHASWGEHSLQAGSIQATMVPAIPLPNTQRFNEKQVLTSEAPSPAPPPPAPKAVPPPKPNEVLIPEKVTPKPPKIAEKPSPAPPPHPQPVAETPKATSGETAGVRIPEAVVQVKNGTASITVDDRSFGERYAYYARIVDSKVSQSWNSQPLTSGATQGMRTVIVFTINPDGTPSDPRVLVKSGSSAFDVSALRTIQRIDGFGPLPQNKAITVEFALDYKQP